MTTETDEGAGKAADAAWRPVVVEWATETRCRDGSIEWAYGRYYEKAAPDRNTP